MQDLLTDSVTSEADCKSIFSVPCTLKSPKRINIRGKVVHKLHSKKYALYTAINAKQFVTRFGRSNPVTCLSIPPPPHILSFPFVSVTLLSPLIFKWVLCQALSVHISLFLRRNTFLAACHGIAKYCSQEISELVQDSFLNSTEYICFFLSNYD
jgi:hypothetical protein